METGKRLVVSVLNICDLKKGMQQNNMLFLQKRIFEIGSALMSNESNAGYKFPTTIINALKIDDKGNLYALIQQPERKFQEEDLTFPTQLKFYRKGKPFHINVQGTAFLMDEVDLLNTLLHVEGTEEFKNSKKAMVVKVKMEEITYFEWKQDAYGSGLRGWLEKCYQWLAGINPFQFKLKLQPGTPNTQYAH